MIPASVDLRPQVNEVPVCNQGQIGSCSTFGAAEAIQTQYERAGLPVPIFSHLYLYYWERWREGYMGDGLINFDDCGRTLAERGVCLESSWPYVEAYANSKPPPECDVEAAKYKIKGWEWPIGDKRIYLAQGKPLVFKMMLNTSFDEAWNTIHDWKKFTWDFTSPVRGGHIVSCIGYDDDAQMWLCQNSWGPDGGDGGFFGIPYNSPGTLYGAWFLDAGVGIVNAGYHSDTAPADFDRLLNWAEATGLLPKGSATCEFSPPTDSHYLYRLYNADTYIGLDLDAEQVVVFNPGQPVRPIGALADWLKQIPS